MKHLHISCPNDLLGLDQLPRELLRHFYGVRVCVTGGAGFIGSHLVDALVTAGADVAVVDDLTTGRRENLAHVGSRITLIEGSILTPEQWTHALHKCRYVFHLAAMGSVPRSIVEPQRCIDTNVRGTLNVLMAAHNAGVRRVVFSGSSSAYGVSPGADTKSESMPPLPRSPYAASKLAGEHLCRAWSSSYGLDTAVLRYFNIFGPRQNGASAYAAVVAAFADAMNAGKAGTIHGDGHQTRDFTFVANAVFANLLAAAHEADLGGEIFNVATGNAVSISQLHDAMARLFRLPNAQPVHLDERRGDVAWSKADITRANRVLGFHPIVPFEEGLAATVHWFQSQSQTHSRPITIQLAA